MRACGKTIYGSTRDQAVVDEIGAYLVEKMRQEHPERQNVRYIAVNLHELEDGRDVPVLGIKWEEA